MNSVLSQSCLIEIISGLLKKYHADSALLFGSYAREEATEKSDIDLLVFGGEQFRATDIFALAEELHEITGKAVDVYEVREVNPASSLYHEIMKDGVHVA